MYDSVFCPLVVKHVMPAGSQGNPASVPTAATAATSSGVSETKAGVTRAAGSVTVPPVGDLLTPDQPKLRVRFFARKRCEMVCFVIETMEAFFGGGFCVYIGIMLCEVGLGGFFARVFFFTPYFISSFRFLHKVVVQSASDVVPTEAPGAAVDCDPYCVLEVLPEGSRPKDGAAENTKYKTVCKVRAAEEYQLGKRFGCLREDA